MGDKTTVEFPYNRVDSLANELSVKLRILYKYLIVVAAVVVICLNPKITRSQSPSITIGTVESLNSLNPADATDVFTWEVLTHLYTGLTRQIPGMLRYELALATSHTVSEDHLTHTFTIKSDAAFEDGTSITAQTFADSINRALQGRAKSVIAPYIKAAGVDDSGALAITLSRPIPFIEQLLALPPFFPVHPTQPTLGNGIYKVESFEAGKSLSLIANPIWQGNPPASPSITLRHYDTPGELRRALSAHEIDVAWRGLTPDEAANAKQTPDIREITAPGSRAFYLLISQTKAPFNELPARRGILRLINRDTLTSTSLRGTGAPLYSLLPEPLSSDSSDVRYPELDLTAAQNELREAGFSRFKTINSEIQTSRLIYGELVLRANSQLSNDLERSEIYAISPQDIVPQTFLYQVNRQTFRAIVVGWTPVVPHPYAYLQPLLGANGELAFGAQYNNAEVNALLEQAAVSDENEQAALYNQIQTIALSDVVAVPLWQDKQFLFAWNSIDGINIEPNYLLRYDRLRRN